VNDILSVPEVSDEISKRLVLLRIVVSGLASGCLSFLIIVVLLGSVGPPRAQAGQNFITLMAVVVGCLMLLVVRPAVVWFMTAKSRREILAHKFLRFGSRPPPSLRDFFPPVWRLLLGPFLKKTPVNLGERPTAPAASDEPLYEPLALLDVYHIRTIAGCAMLEGAAFFCLAAYMIEHNPAGLAVACVLMATVLLHFPTRSRVAGWLEDQCRILDDWRATGAF
jgi:uncharacterized membrane protein